MSKALPAKSQPESIRPGRPSSKPPSTKSVRARARREWLTFLASKNRTDALFELEMLLEGAVCFGARQNRARGFSIEPAANADYRSELQALSLALRASLRASATVLGLRASGERDITREAERSGTPADALRELRIALIDHADLTAGLLRLDRIPEALFRAAHRSLARDIRHSGFLPPLGPFDVEHASNDAQSNESWETLFALPTEATRRSLASVFTALRRARGCAALCEEYAQRASTGIAAYVLLSGLRHDLRMITYYLTKTVGDHLADGFEEVVLSLDAQDREIRRAELATVATSLKQLRANIQALANVLRVEALKLLERDAPPLEPHSEQMSDTLVRAAAISAELRTVIDEARDDLRGTLQLPRLFHGDSLHLMRRNDALRRNVWMFMQVLRAFLAKAEAFSVEGLDRWDSPVSLHFAEEFCNHFRALGIPVVQAVQYPGASTLVTTLAALTGAEGLGALHVSIAVRECIVLFEHLERVLIELSNGDALRDAPFDKRAAAETLKLYLETSL